MNILGSPRFPLVSTPLRTSADRKLWTLCYQRVVGPSRSEIRMHNGRRRLDVLARNGQKIEFQQAKETVQNAHGKELSHATGAMWVFCVINQHHNEDLYVYRQGANSRVGFSWTKAWALIGECNGTVLLDLGYSSPFRAHVLMEVDNFNLHSRRATGTGVLRDAQEFCYWMRDGDPLLPYSWAPRAA
ncbi:hypothetical protein ACFYXL_33045 [Streptomyces tsukubensis]|uniref:hypothetical protein n=1 Tax=Streptomyces tsukubensis TaxID=83656 RepID=UPI0036CC0E4B